jgi:hypothetical protein
VTGRGLRFLETPVSGTSEQVRRGDGVGLIGGDPALAAEVAPVLDALFPRRFHVGRVGDGGRAKLAVNLILGLNRLALAEGLVFAERLGLDPAAFLKIAVGSAAYSQVMETKGRKMVEADFSAEGRARQSLKDFQLMLDQAARVGQKLPLAEVNADVLAACLRHGEGELDNSVVIAEIRRRISPDRATYGGRSARANCATSPAPMRTVSRSITSAMTCRKARRSIASAPTISMPSRRNCSRHRASSAVASWRCVCVASPQAAMMARCASAGHASKRLRLASSSTTPKKCPVRLT